MFKDTIKPGFVVLYRDHSASTVTVGPGTNSETGMSFVSLVYQMMLGSKVMPLHLLANFVKTGMFWNISNAIRKLIDSDWLVTFLFEFLQSVILVFRLLVLQEVCNICIQRSSFMVI